MTGCDAMAEESTGQEPVRKSLHTAYMRRDAHNPEYLDAEHALARFTPLIDSIMRQLRSWYSRYDTRQDDEDLRSFIQTEFLRLHDRYDPSYGVDFPGYIKMNLERRVRYYVGRSQKRIGNEVLAFASDITGNYIESIPDEKAEREIGRIDCILSIPVEQIDDEVYRGIIEKIIAGVDLYSLAAMYGVSPRSMAAKIDAAGKYARSVMQREDVDGFEEKHPQDG